MAGGDMVWVHTRYGIYPVYTRYIPTPQIRAWVYTHFWACSWGPPGAPQGVLFGGHKGQFGSWGAPQSRNCTCYLLIDAPMVSVLTMVFVGADTGHKQTSCPCGPITMTCSGSRDPDLARCCSEPRDVAACAELLTKWSVPHSMFSYAGTWPHNDVYWASIELKLSGICGQFRHAVPWCGQSRAGKFAGLGNCGG